MNAMNNEAEWCPYGSQHREGYLKHPIFKVTDCPGLDLAHSHWNGLTECLWNVVTFFSPWDGALHIHDKDCPKGRSAWKQILWP